MANHVRASTAAISNSTILALLRSPLQLIGLKPDCRAGLQCSHATDDYQHPEALVANESYLLMWHGMTQKACTAFNSANGCVGTLRASCAADCR